MVNQANIFIVEHKNSPAFCFYEQINSINNTILQHTEIRHLVNLKTEKEVDLTESLSSVSHL